MRIGMLGWEFPPFSSGGLGVHCYELTLNLCKLGVEIDFFLPASDQKLVSSHPNLRLIQVAKTTIMPYLFSGISKRGEIYGKDLISAVEEYSKRCEEIFLENFANRKYDLLHSHDWLTISAALSIKRKLNIPYLLTFHSTEFDRSPYPWDFISNIEKEGAKNADLIIAVSKREKEQVLKLGAEEKKIRVVYNGIDFEKFQKTKIEQLKKLKKKKIVLFFGRLTEQKGPVQFLHAAKKVLEKEKDIEFLIAGRGELLPLLINLSISLGISQHVKFLGYLSEEDQKRIYKIADVYVMPSTSEPFGITALEALSSGTPIIISKTSGVSEIIKTAIKVDFWDINAMAEKIIALLRYKPLSEVMRKISYTEVRKHTWEKTAQGTLQVYNELLAKR